MDKQLSRMESPSCRPGLENRDSQGGRLMVSTLIQPMKTLNALTILLAVTSAVAQGQVANNASTASQTAPSAAPSPTPCQVVDVGPHHRVWQWQTFETLPNGQMATNTHSYRELASGLNYQDPTSGQWLPAEPTIEAFGGGAIVRHCQHNIIFANNINTAGAIDMQTADGKELRSTILGLMYSDPTTGQAVQIAQIQDSEGTIASPNEVIYTNAFQGVMADVLYRNRIEGVEQDVILREQLPAPEAYGMNPATTRLGVFTEFLSPPEADVTDLPVDPQTGDSDQDVNWGATSLGHGKAFWLGSETNAVPVTKHYSTVNGRYFLLEKVRLQDIQAALSQLPQQASNARRLPGMASTHFRYPLAPTHESASRPMRMAMNQTAQKGYVLDYNTLSAAYTNYDFQGDTTYYISGNLTLAGANNIFEGGTVIKYTNGVSIALNSGAFATFTSTPYHPVVFTAKDDNSVGDTVSGSTGSPSGYYAQTALSITYPSSGQFSNFRISYANIGMSVSSTGLNISDAQFVSCGEAVFEVSSTVTINNALFLNGQYDFFLMYGSISANATTFSGNNGLASDCDGPLCLTNCILANVTNVGGASGACNGFYKSKEFGLQCFTNTFYPFQQVGGGNCYLTNGCAFMTAGTTNIPAAFLTDLTSRTVFPPLALPAEVVWTNSMNLSPVVARDNAGTLALGYHYAPLDYAFGWFYSTNTITVNPGTCIGMFSTNSTEYGVGLAAGGEFICQGLANSLIHLTEFNTVQENVGGGWLEPTYALVTDFGGSYGGTPQPVISYNFTDSSVMANDSAHLYFGCTNVDAVENSQFHGGQWNVSDQSVNVTNCFFERTVMTYAAMDGGMPSLVNNLFWYGTFSLRSSVTNTVVRNNLFDNTIISATRPRYPCQTTNGGFNGYVTNCNTLKIVYPTDVILSSSPAYQTSWFGNYYLPTNCPLINKGSTNANYVGLYHFTTQTNQVPEGNTVVDIGYHYVATDAYGNPLDTNGDGIPDYLEDANGDGVYDAGDSGNWLISSYNGLSSSSVLSVFTPLK